MAADEYLQNILYREAVDTSAYSPVRSVQDTINPTIRLWAGSQLSDISPSGSFAKGTANKSGTDIDLFISLLSSTTNTLEEIYESLFSSMQSSGYSPKRQNVSINIQVNGYSVDLVPAKRQDNYSSDHSLFRRRANTWTKTNIQKHINLVRERNRLQETRIIKLWRNQHGIDFPSFYLELVVIDAVSGRRSNDLSRNVMSVFSYLRDTFPTARFVDPANTNNIISDDLSVSGKGNVKAAAINALAATNWDQIVS